jgi:hypothetical protein
MGSRDWDRIKAELRSRLPDHRRHGRQQPVHPNRTACSVPKTPKTDTDSILKHIEEALQEHNDKV